MLLIPIPNRLKDGGTVVYQAILYSIENVHKLSPTINAEQEYLERYTILYNFYHFGSRFALYDKQQAVKRERKENFQSFLRESS